MRTLKVIIARAPGAAPVLLSAALIQGCGSRSGLALPENESDASSGATGGTISSGGTGGTISTGGSGGILLGGGGAISTGGTGGSGGTGGNPYCDPFAHISEQTVSIPDPGVPANPGQICAVSASPVVSNTAARVTLVKYSPALELAQGTILFDPAIASSVVAPPKLEVVSASPPELQNVQFDSFAAIPGGWSFHAAWSNPLSLTPNGFTTLTVRVDLVVACDPSGADTRLVTADTVIDLCILDTDVEWVSSGDVCTVCQVIAEMAPSPIVPDVHADELPLARVLRLRLVELARIGDSVILLAENDGGDEIVYEWEASSGNIEKLAPDIILWRPGVEPAPRSIRAAAVSDAGAAVASFLLDEAA